MTQGTWRIESSITAWHEETTGDFATAYTETLAHSIGSNGIDTYKLYNQNNELAASVRKGWPVWVSEKYRNNIYAKS